MEKQDKRNAQALAATGRGGSAVQTDLEQGLQRLLDLRDGLKQRRAVEKSERDTKFARLDEDAKKALKRSMDTHAKKRKRSSSERLSGGSLRAGSSVATLSTKVEAATQLVRIAMEENVEAHAEMAWMKARKFHATHPHVAIDPGPQDAWIAKAVEAHRQKVQIATTDDNPPSEEDEIANGEVELAVDM